MRKLRSLLVGAVVGGSGAIIALLSCSAPAETNFGNPNGLDRKNIPGEGGVEALVCGSGDGGLGDGGCPSWSATIYPYFVANGAWKCADPACHGGKSDPPIDPTSAASCYASLKAINVAKIPYLGADGGQASLECNLQGTCGSKMPKPPGKDPTTDELCLVQAWIACGAPNN
ncbi:MAG: hypothetical protein KC657_04745 [Myxococcales bacterium]|nr:hypothetical protein [Myxococcales bacterium]